MAVHLQCDAISFARKLFMCERFLIMELPIKFFFLFVIYMAHSKCWEWLKMLYELQRKNCVEWSLLTEFFLMLIFLFVVAKSMHFPPFSFFNLILFHLCVCVLNIYQASWFIMCPTIKWKIQNRFFFFLFIHSNFGKKLKLFEFLAHFSFCYLKIMKNNG